MHPKQIIVMRIKYPDGKGGTMQLRRGKQIAQACHASMSFLAKKHAARTWYEWWFNISKEFRQAEKEWLAGSFTKIALSVDTEDELMIIYNKAVKAGLEVHLITDSGKTEFHGVPTRTCLAIGPDYPERIDPITKDLKLM